MNRPDVKEKEWAICTGCKQLRKVYLRTKRKHPYCGPCHFSANTDQQ